MKNRSTSQKHSKSHTSSLSIRMGAVPFFGSEIWASRAAVPAPAAPRSPRAAKAPGKGKFQRWERANSSTQPPTQPPGQLRTLGKPSVLGKPGSRERSELCWMHLEACLEYREAVLGAAGEHPAAPWGCSVLLPPAGTEGQMAKRAFQTGCREQLCQVVPGKAVSPPGAPEPWIGSQITSTCVYTACDPKPRGGGSIAARKWWDQSLQWLCIQILLVAGDLSDTVFCLRKFCAASTKGFAGSPEVRGFFLWCSQTSQVPAQVSVVVPRSSAHQSWGFQLAGSADSELRVIHPWNIVFSVCAQNKGLADSYMGNPLQI